MDTEVLKPLSDSNICSMGLENIWLNLAFFGKTPLVNSGPLMGHENGLCCLRVIDTFYNSTSPDISA